MENQSSKSSNSLKLQVFAFGLAVGITWAIAMFILGLATMVFDWGRPLMIILSSVYWGYQPTFLGVFAGSFWAFLDAFVGGVIIAWIYNRVVVRSRH